MKTDVFDITGKKIGKVDLPKEIFGAKVNPTLMAQAVRVYLSNQRKAYPKTKTRGEVSLTKAKWYRQKGTGRARHGARSAPIFVGGGVAHGPTGTQNWEKDLPKKARQQALASALSSKFRQNEVMVIDGLEKIKGKTKELVSVLEKLAKNQKVLLVLPKMFENVVRAGRNIPCLRINQTLSLNTYEVLEGGKILMTPQTIKLLEKR